MAGTHARGRRSESFRVRRWLQMGAASAGVSAALFGLSSLGPQVGVALADESGSSSSSDSGGSAGSESGGSSTGGTGSGSGQSSSPGSAADSGPKATVGSSPSSSDTEKGDTEKGDTEKDAPKKDDPKKDALADETSVPSSSPNKTPKPSSAALVGNPTPEIAKTVAPKTESASAIAAAEPTPPWAVHVEAPEDPRKQFIADQLRAWTNDSLGWIDSLPVPSALRWHLEGALWTTRRSLFNVAPTVAPLTVTGLSNTSVTGRVDAVDPESDAIVYRLVRGPSSGTVQLNADGSFTYTPSADFDGVDSFVVRAQDLGLHVNVLDPFRGAGTTAGALVNQGAIKFDFNYTTGSEYWSTAARAALQSAGDAIGAYFLVTAPVVITYDVMGQNDPTGDVLASADSGLVFEGQGFWRTVVQDKILSGVDENGTEPDGEIVWNWGNSWSLGDDVAADSYDFKSTAMHELIHSFGFLSGVGPAGTNNAKIWPLFAGFIVTAAGARPIGSDGSWNSAFDPYLTGADGGLYLNGANAVAAYGGQLVPLFTPSAWDSGSSVSHLDDATFNGAMSMLMNARTDSGLAVRVLSPIEMGIMRDIGYTVVLPATAMMQP